jgi:hypothetical protein
VITSELLAARVRPFLQEGDVIRCVFPVSWGRHRVQTLLNDPPYRRGYLVAVVDQETVVLECGYFRDYTPRRVLTRLPPPVAIGPLRGFRSVKAVGLSRRLGGIVETLAEWRSEIAKVEPDAR